MARTKSNKGRLPEDIAIVGMAGMFPGAESLAQYWSNICRRLEMIREPLPEWDAERYLNGTEVTGIPTARGGFLGEAFRIDPVALGVMPSSIDGSEPDQFLALKIAQAALDDALHGNSFDPVRTGIILGHSTILHRSNASIVQHGVVLDQTRKILGQLMPDADPAVLDEVRAAMERQLPAFNADMVPGLVPNVMTGRIANKLDLRGPNYLIDAACSASLLSVQSAMIELRAGRSDLMLAGGVNASIPAEVIMVFAQLGALSGTGHVRPFSEGGDGTLLGEGLGVLALKRRKDAERDGDRIYAVLKGVGQSSDGKGTGLLAPRLEGEILAIERAYEDARLPVEPPALIEAHGTGIALGDRTEINALRHVFGERAGHGLPVTALGAVKSMIGHCIPAAGAAGLIKTASALYHRTLPPTLVEEVREGLPVDETGLYLNTETRPWITALDEMGGAPRRAGVNAFGFGGINSHAILEQSNDSAPPKHWAEELIVLAACSTAELASRARHLATRFEANERKSLATIAASAAAAAGTGPCRLALVVTSHSDLLEKLDKAATRLEAGKGSFRLRSGIIASDTPVDGKLAFMFPGEGAQYQKMLGELLIAFPEARAWFDFWDGLFPERTFPPSASVFPPPTTLDKAVAQDLEDRLFGLELGSESAFVANQALLAVMRKLEITPDVLVGHSSGEHAALASAGVFGSFDDETSRTTFAERIRTLNRLYSEMEGSDDIPGGALLTIGGVARARILELVDADPDVYLALDNCNHQAVLYGPRTKLEKIVETVGREGAISAFLPFDRPYHTPLFAPVAEKVASVYEDMNFETPKRPVYSCATAAPMPQAPGEVMDTVVTQWKSRVRFTETVERMFDDGVRLFLEVGPSANLTSFVDDALKGRGVTALSLDSRRRGGLSHFLQSLGRLWVSGRDFNVLALFSTRADPIDLDAEVAPDRERFLDNTLPFIRLPEEEAAALAVQLRPAAARPEPGASGQGVTETGTELAPSAAAPDGTAQEFEMTGYFETMDRFLEIQGKVMEAALGADVPSETADWRPPLIHRILSQDADHLVAETDADPDAEPFLRQHVLYASAVSDIDPDLYALAVQPIAVSVEVAMEAAYLLTGVAPNAMENLKALNWVAFDKGPATYRIEAQRLSDTRVRVSLYFGTELLLETDTVADGVLAGAALPDLSAPRAPVWQDDELYTTGMFHGPLYQCVSGLLAWDESGVDAVLADSPLDGFLADRGESNMLINPVLLDQLGHVVAFWFAQAYGTDFSSFPSSIERIDLPGARAEATAGSLMRCRVGFTDTNGRPTAEIANAHFLGSDLDLLDAAGNLLIQVRGFQNRLFEVPHRFYEARYRVRGTYLGHPVETGLPETTVWAVPAFDDAFLVDAGGIWLRVLAATVLSRAERETWHTMTGPMKRRRDWLMGRIAAKEAVCGWLAERYGVAVLPADVEIVPDADGRPFVNASMLAALGLPAPAISLAHSGGGAAAVAAPQNLVAGVDLESGVGVDAALLGEGGFSEAERALTGAETDGLIAGWCVKEAVAKLLGSGLTGRPKSFRVEAIDATGARVLAPDGTAHNVRLTRLDWATLAVTTGTAEAAAGVADLAE